jgi:hypothetical protein
MSETEYETSEELFPQYPDGHKLLVSYDHTPGDPGCHTMRNGDPGWPSSPAECDLTAVVDEAGNDILTSITKEQRDALEQDAFDHVAAMEESYRKQQAEYQQEARERRAEEQRFRDSGW